MIPWGIRFARAEHTEMLVMCPRKSKGKEGTEDLSAPTEESTPVHKAVFAELERLACEDVVLRHEISEGEASTDHDQVIVSLKEIISPDPETSFVQQVPKLGIQLLLIPTFEPVRSSNRDVAEWEEQLFNTAPCGVVCIRGTVSTEDKPLRLLFASEQEEDADDDFALKQTARLGRATKGKVTLLYVRPFDDKVAEQVAQRHLDRLEKTIKNRKLEIEKTIQLNDSFTDGINQVDLDEFDLVVAGTRSGKVIRQLLAQLKSNSEDKSVPLAIMRQAVPLTDQLWLKFKRFVRARIPQISREHRVNLVDRLTSSSNFDFDFMALISLSTLIAALGLVQNSVAVVIGAMLVAPLMTPLVAIGLALVQGNIRLLKTAVAAVLYGFSVALMIGAVVGIMIYLTISNYQMGSELVSRGSPNLLDLVVALASGVAAAYAMGRPHLLSALPGVAIAAALVPPIATSGIAFSIGQWEVAGGALLLFCTNIVAIILGTTITFWSVGFSTHLVPGDPQRAPKNWPRYWFIGFVVISFLIAAEMFVLNPMSGSKNVDPSINKAENIEQLNPPAR